MNNILSIRRAGPILPPSPYKRVAHDRSVQPARDRDLITEAEIAARTTQLAHIISDHYRGTKQLVVVGLLRGSFVFIADLVRRIDLPVEVDFMTVSSYGDKKVSSRQVRIIQDLETAIDGRDVLIVEDIIDTGHIEPGL